MAEGLARASAPEGWGVHSAGSRPTQLNPYATTVLAEVHIDSSGQHAKGLHDIPLADADWVITLCAQEECPVGYTKGKQLHWPLSDPASVPNAEALSRWPMRWVGQFFGSAGGLLP